MISRLSPTKVFGRGPSTNRSTNQSSRLAARKRIAGNGSGGISANANLVTLKFRPQIRHTRSMPASCAVILNEDREGGEGGEADATAGVRVTAIRVTPVPLILRHAPVQNPQLLYRRPHRPR